MSRGLGQLQREILDSVPNSHTLQSVGQLARRWAEKGLEKGVVVNVTADKVVRLAPPINISRQELDQGLDRLFEAMASL